MNLLLVLVGLLPFGIGKLMDSWIMSHPAQVLPFLVVAIVFLGAWGAVARLGAKKLENPNLAVVLLHVVPTVDLVLLGIQLLLMGRYFTNLFGVLTQLYFLPVLHLSFTLSSWFPVMFVTYLVAYLLMLAAARLACLGLKQPEKKENEEEEEK